MKKSLMVLGLAMALVFSFTAMASAKYASYDNISRYLSWQGAEVLYNAINDTNGATQTSPHGGYTQTSVKCAVCHSIHRASYAENHGKILDLKLSSGSAACSNCHAAWGASPVASALVEVGAGTSGPHIGTAGETCIAKGCHGSMHGNNPSKYATVLKYNLSNNTSNAAMVGNTIDEKLDTAIASGNTNAKIGVASTTPEMKAYATGYVCAPCHGNSVFSVAKNGVNAGQAMESDGDTLTGAMTGHISAGPYGYEPVCDECHDLVGVKTGTTAFPHANRGIDVYVGRINNHENFGHYRETILPAEHSSTIVSATSGEDTDFKQYGLWMTSTATITASAMTTAAPITGSSTNGFNLQDGACLKCHSGNYFPE